MVHADDVAVPARGHEAHKGRLQIRMRHVIRADMALDVVDGNQRLFRRVGQPLRPAHAGEQRAHQPRAVGHGHRVDVVQRQARLPQRLIQKRVDGLHVHARCDFRHHAAVQRVHVDLSGDGVGALDAAVLHHGDGGLVAGALHRENHRRAPGAQRVRLGAHSRFVIRHFKLSLTFAISHTTPHAAAGAPTIQSSARAPMRRPIEANMDDGQMRISRSVRGSSSHRSLVNSR